MRRVNGWLTIFRLFMIPVSLITHWVTSVVDVSALSLWALVSGHWSAWQAARVEVNQQEVAKKREQEDLAGDVVAKLVHETDVEPAGSPCTDAHKLLTTEHRLPISARPQARLTSCRHRDPTGAPRRVDAVQT
jgi:hypothetical protein